MTLSSSSFGLLSLSDVIIHHSVSHSMFADDTEMRIIIIIIIIIIGDSADSSVGTASVLKARHSTDGGSSPWCRALGIFLPESTSSAECVCVCVCVCVCTRARARERERERESTSVL